MHSKGLFFYFSTSQHQARPKKFSPPDFFLKKRENENAKSFFDFCCKERNVVDEHLGFLNFFCFRVRYGGKRVRARKKSQANDCIKNKVKKKKKQQTAMRETAQKRNRLLSPICPHRHISSKKRKSRSSSFFFFLSFFFLLLYHFGISLVTTSPPLIFVFFFWLISKAMMKI